MPHDPQLALLDRLALPVCQFTRPPRCQRLRGQAASGHDQLTHLPCYGFRLHARVGWPGVLCQIELTPGNGQALATAEDLTASTTGVVRGDRNVWAPRRRAALALRGIHWLRVPCRRRPPDPWPRLSRALARWRYRIDTRFGFGFGFGFGQLVERTSINRI